MAEHCLDALFAFSLHPVCYATRQLDAQCQEGSLHDVLARCVGNNIQNVLTANSIRVLRLCCISRPLSTIMGDHWLSLFFPGFILAANWAPQGQP